ncbi:MAG: cation transporter [Anaerolineales bacterium]|nr:cation transporter [Chloroflexota bacterium]MBL6982214.1 cation transporter [Anaerolineales bacterium]
MMQIHHEHNHQDDHTHHHDDGIIQKVKSLFHFHSHDRRHVAADAAFSNNQEGIRTIWIALTILLITSILQIVIVYFSKSVSLLADTTHNIGDGLNSIPLLIAFYLARRLPTRRYNYGFGRAEDIAGIFIVLSIAVSAGIVFWESFQRLIDPQPILNLGWVAAASVIGFFGNEWVAIIQIRVGRRIGSAAMVADGLHARTDGLTSLAVLIAAGGAWLGFPIVDPIIGFLIGITILFITWDSMKAVWYRLMDAIEPEILTRAEHVIGHHAEIKELKRLRMRWVGHQLHAEVCIAVDANVSTMEGHAIAEEIRHDLFHEVVELTEIVVHVDPWFEDDDPAHVLTRQHEPVPQLLTT